MPFTSGTETIGSWAIQDLAEMPNGQKSEGSGPGEGAHSQDRVVGHLAIAASVMVLNDISILYTLYIYLHIYIYNIR